MPVDLVLRQPSSTTNSATKTLSNGVGAARNYDDAVVTGVLEIIERDAVALWWYGHMPAHAVNPEVLKEPGFIDILRKSRRDPQRRLRFLDITTEFNLPVVAVISANVDGSEVACGFSCRKNITSAIIQAFLEMCQMELAQYISAIRLKHQGEEALSPLDKILINRRENLNLNKYQQFKEHMPPKAGRYDDGSDSLSHLIETVNRNGLNIYAANLTRNTIQIPVSRVVIPGLQPPTTNFISRRLKKVMRQTGVQRAPIVGSTAPI